MCSVVSSFSFVSLGAYTVIAVVVVVVVVITTVITMHSYFTYSIEI